MILYGSRAKGNYKNGSDIDLTLFAAEADLSFLFKIENEIDDLLLPYKADFLDDVRIFFQTALRQEN